MNDERATTTASDHSLRSYLAGLDAAGQVLTLHEPVSVDGELAAVLSRLDCGPAVQFRAVCGATFPVVGNVLNSRTRIAAALGVAESGISEAIARAIRSPLPTRSVSAGACQEVVARADFGQLPIPTFFRRESGKYITAGVICVRDVVTGERNLSFARFKVLDATHAMLGVSPNHHLGKMVARAGEQGRTLPIAVVLGSHPAVMQAACLYLGFGDDELECAGAMLGAGVEVVPSRDAGIPVPANAELILEGVVHPDQRVEEGLVSEFHGRYHNYGAGYRTEFHTMTHRKDALFQVITPGLHDEHLLLGAVSIAAGLRTMLRNAGFDVVEVAVPRSAGGRTAAVVSVRAPQEGIARAIIDACFASVALVKQVVVVDDAIDPWNAEAVEWARTQHARPERDFVFRPGSRTDRSEPLNEALRITKFGVDATATPNDRAEGWEFARMSDIALAAADAILQRSATPIAPRPLLDGLHYA